jgi:hypothetical protein
LGSRSQQGYPHQATVDFSHVKASDGDPIALTDDKKGYRCTFKLVPDNSPEYARLAAEHEDY